MLYLTHTITTTNGKIEHFIDVDEVALKTALGVTPTTTVYWGTLQKASNNAQTIEQALIGLNYAQRTTTNKYIVCSDSEMFNQKLVLTSPSGKYFQLGVDDAGNITTTLIDPSVLI